MPYIPQDRRMNYKPGPVWTDAHNMSVGELNYCITRLLHEWLGCDLYYANINAAIGILECAKLELYRVVAAPYEDVKREENGPVLLEADDVDND